MCAHTGSVGKQLGAGLINSLAPGVLVSDAFWGCHSWSCCHDDLQMWSNLAFDKSVYRQSGNQHRFYRGKQDYYAQYNATPPAVTALCAWLRRQCIRNEVKVEAAKEVKMRRISKFSRKPE